jgi:hypothetical protein
MRFSLLAILSWVPLVLAGCGGGFPSIISPIGPFAPGTYSGTVNINIAQHEDGKTEATEQETEIPSTEIVNSAGMLCTMNGQPITTGMILEIDLGGASSNQTVQGVVISANGITVTMTGRLTLSSPTIGTITGNFQRTLKYTYIDENSFKFEVSGIGGDDTGKYAITFQGSGVLRK